MKKTVIAVLAATLSLPLLFPDCSAADEEPSWEACGELDGGDNARMCQDKAATYWDRRLNATYQQVIKNCKTAHCRKKLREAERAWIKYRDLMAEATGEDAGGYKDKGSMIEAMEQTRYLATKHQTLVLESRLDERAFDVEAGPIWSHEHAKTRCPEVADEWAKAHPGWHAEWTEAWTTTVWGKMSVCNIKVKHPHAEGHKAKGYMIEAKEKTRDLATKHQTLVLESRLDERAFDVEAGPIWSHEHAKTRCPEVADEWAKAHPGWHAEWTEAWTTTVWGKMSVCNIKVKHLHAEGHKAKESMIKAKEQGEAPGKR